MKEQSARVWKIRSTEVNAGNFKCELWNQLRSTVAVNVLSTLLELDFQNLEPNETDPWQKFINSLKYSHIIVFVLPYNVTFQ